MLGTKRPIETLDEEVSRQSREPPSKAGKAVQASKSQAEESEEPLTEDKAPYKTSSRESIDHPPTLVDLLTPEQQKILADKLAGVLKDGFGEVTIEVQKGHVRFVRVQSSHDLGNGENGDSA